MIKKNIFCEATLLVSSRKHLLLMEWNNLLGNHFWIQKTVYSYVSLVCVIVLLLICPLPQGLNCI